MVILPGDLYKQSSQKYHRGQRLVTGKFIFIKYSWSCYRGQASYEEHGAQW